MRGCLVRRYLDQSSFFFYFSDHIMSFWGVFKIFRKVRPFSEVRPFWQTPPKWRGCLLGKSIAQILVFYFSTQIVSFPDLWKYPARGTLKQWGSIFLADIIQMERLSSEIFFFMHVDFFSFFYILCLPMFLLGDSHVKRMEEVHNFPQFLILSVSEEKDSIFEAPILKKLERLKH